MGNVLGWVPLGTVHLFFALMMAAFPEILPREAKRRQSRSALYRNEGSTTGGLYLIVKGDFNKVSEEPCSGLQCTQCDCAHFGRRWLLDLHAKVH